MQHLFSRRHTNNQFNTSNNQLTPTPVQQRFSGTISTSIGAQDSSVMDSLGSLDDEKEGILILEEWGRSSRLQKNLLNQNLKLTSNIFAKSEEDEDEEIDGEEDLNAFLEDNNERNILKRNSKNLNEGDKQERQENNNQLSHPLVSVV